MLSHCASQTNIFNSKVQCFVIPPLCLYVVKTSQPRDWLRHHKPRPLPAFLLHVSYSNACNAWKGEQVNGIWNAFTMRFPHTATPSPTGCSPHLSPPWVPRPSTYSFLPSMSIMNISVPTFIYDKYHNYYWAETFYAAPEKGKYLCCFMFRIKKNTDS